MATTSRAVLRSIEPGSDIECTSCGLAVKFAARTHPQQVIANVYVDGVWDRVEHYHEPCYEAAGLPYGAPAVPAERSTQAGEPGDRSS